MKLYNISNTIKNIKEIPFKLEKDIQNIVEANINELLNIKFLATEYSIKNYRFDTVGFDIESNTFIIVEYKRGKNESLVDQGYAYLKVLLEYKAEFVLLYNKVFNESKQVNDFSWESTRIYFVSPKFTSYQIDATSFSDMPFNLFEIKQFENDMLIFEEINKKGKISSSELATPDNSTISEVRKEIVVYTEEDHLSKCNENIEEIYQEMKARFSEICDFETQYKKLYITFKEKISFCQVVIQKNIIKVYLNFDNKSFTELQDNSKIRDVTNVGHWGSFNYEYTVEDMNDLDDLVYCVRRILK